MKLSAHRAQYLGSCTLLLLGGCSSPGETPGNSGTSDGLAGSASSGGSGSAGAPAQNGGAPAIAGSAAAGQDTGGASGGGTGGISPGGGPSGGSGSGGLFGGADGDFPPLEVPLDLPESAPAAPCPAGSVLQKLGSPALYSWPGTVFSSAALSGQGQNHAPSKLQLQVMNGAQPVSNCEVRFRAAAGNGWGFGASKATDQQGKLYGYWTAGQPGAASISAVIALAGGGESKVDFSGTVSAHDSRTDSVHLYYDVDGSYSEFKVRVTPLSAPPATYYSALNWQDSYAGIQFDGDTSLVIFSVWDAAGEKAEITDPGACNATVGFGGEGTGTSCRFRLPPSKNGAIAGLPDDYRLEVGNTYELHLIMKASLSGGTAHSLTFTDLTRHIGPISVGTQTTGTAFHGGGHASSFVEEWTDHGSCLSNGRSVLYHGTQAKVGGAWQSVTSAAFNPNYINSNNEICGNYLATRVENTWLMSSGGSDYVGPPYVPGDAAFKKPQPALELP